jgi:hypothetical protein
MFGLKALHYPILTIFIAVIISAYNHHTADIVIQHELPSINVDVRTKTEGVVMLYPTKKGGDEWFMGLKK